MQPLLKAEFRSSTATFDGARFIVEFICDEWGKTKLPPQAGMAVYELGKTEKLFTVRIHDDLSPPGRTANPSVNV